jgi:hypothetical protein
MKKVKVLIKSMCALLMNRFDIEGQNEGVQAKRKDTKYDPETDAWKAAYFDKEQGFYLPSSHVEGALKKAGAEYKIKGTKSYKETILSSVFVEEEKLFLNKKQWDEIDRQAAKIQQARIVRSRPRFNSWQTTFHINFNDERITPEVLKQILVEAGATKGVGDYRPKYGRFTVEKFEVVK